MPRVGFEPTIPTFERAKEVRALDCAAAVIGYWGSTSIKLGQGHFFLRPFQIIIHSLILSYDTMFSEIYPVSLSKLPINKY
jgi:hypothetical protein